MNIIVKKCTKYLNVVIMFIIFLSCSHVENFDNLVLDDKHFYNSDKNLFSGVATKLYPNGNLKLERYFQDGVFHGRSSVWYTNGNLMGQGYYLNGKREGEWSFFNKNGSLRYTSYYRDGEKFTPKSPPPKYMPGYNLREQPIPVFKLF